MKQILMTNHLYRHLKTIADEQNEYIEVMLTPSLEASTSNSTDGRGWLSNASDRALAAAAESGDMVEFRRLREEQKAE